MTIRFGARLKSGISAETYEAVKTFLASQAKGRVTYAYFDGRFTVYFDDRRDLDNLERSFAGVVSATEEVY